VTHLPHPQAHVKKNSSGQQKPLGVNGDGNPVNGMGNMPADRIQKLDDANGDRRSMTGSAMGALARRGGSDQQSNGGVVANNMGMNIDPRLTGIVESFDKNLS